MEKVSIYVKKLLALGLTTFLFYLVQRYGSVDADWQIILLAAAAFLLFAFFDFRITGEKPRFLFGLNQADAFLNKKNGFWSLFKWIVNLLGLIYDLLVWVLWGVYLLFILLAELLLFVKTIAYWIIHAVIWFFRQLFPPFIFLFRMVIHYLVNWIWWIYQAAFRNMKISVNKNFYLIALWGTVPALFIVFLFYAISKLAGMPELVIVSAVFALVPLVWSFGEIAALRFEQREHNDYSSVKYAFRTGFDAIRSVLYYLLIILALIIAVIGINMLGWIPVVSMSLFGISLNLGMAITLLLVFLAVIIVFAGMILPTHIIYHQEHENSIRSSQKFLGVIGRKFPRYLVSCIPAAVFSAMLLVIPFSVMFLTLKISDNIKDQILETRVVKLQDALHAAQGSGVLTIESGIDRLNLYKDLPEKSFLLFEDYPGYANIRFLEEELIDAREHLGRTASAFDKEIAALDRTIAEAGDDTAQLLSRRADLVEEYNDWETAQTKEIILLEYRLKEQKSTRIQMPVLWFFSGLLFALFGGLVVAVAVAYTGNLFYALYDLREDGKPDYWWRTMHEIGKKDANQPLLGFTLLAILAILGYVAYRLNIFIL